MALEMVDKHALVVQWIVFRTIKIRGSGSHPDQAKFFVVFHSMADIKI